MMMPMVLATCTLALQPTTPARCTGRTSRLSRTSLASSTLAPPEAAEDVLPLDVGERKALSVTERLSRSLTTKPGPVLCLRGARGAGSAGAARCLRDGRSAVAA